MTERLRELDGAADGFDDALTSLLQRGGGDAGDVEQVVREIVARVRTEGDAALVEYTRRFDRIEIETDGLELPAERLDRARAAVAPEQWQALETAVQRVRRYHEKQLQHSWEYREADGTRLGQKVTALDRVGLYVPGGRAAYPSSVLMNALPAKVAGVAELIMTVPTPDGVVNNLVLAAAGLCGVDRVFRIGGAQSVAAMAYGTQSVPAVDKIVGPGNIYVATAKRQVFGQVGIDMIAGPSEVVVACDGNAPAEWAAMDMFAQAEHDELAQAILISTDKGFLRGVRAAIDRLLPTLSRAPIVRRSLADHGALIHAVDREQMIAIINRIAPEHLELMLEDAAEVAEQVQHAGAIFIGAHAAEVLGDYCAGPNHVLPTSGTARFSSPLGVYDFQKRTSIIECSPEGAAELGRVAAVLAHAESLTAHAQAAEYRVEAGSRDSKGRRGR